MAEEQIPQDCGAREPRSRLCVSVRASASACASADPQPMSRDPLRTLRTSFLSPSLDDDFELFISFSSSFPFDNLLITYLVVVVF